MILGRGALASLSLFTVAPVRVRTVDRATAGVAIAVAPLVGILLGAVAGGLAWGLVRLGAPEIVAGLAAVAAGALATRGMHLDGLADLADGLGSYAGPERMLAVMRDPGVGAFAVVTLVVALGVQAAAIGRLAALGPLPALGGVAGAAALGRAAFGWCGRRGVPAASSEGLGALVAGTQRAWTAPVWVVVLGAGLTAVRGVPGAVAALVAAAVVVTLTAHARRRLGGVSGDVFGAACETAVTVTLAALTLGP